MTPIDEEPWYSAEKTAEFFNGGPTREQIAEIDDCGQIVCPMTGMYCSNDKEPFCEDMGCVRKSLSSTGESHD